MESELKNCRDDLSRTERRLAEEASDAVYQGLKNQYELLHERKLNLEQQLATKPIACEPASSPEAEVGKALAVFDDVQRILADPSARAEMSSLFDRLGL